MAARRGAGAAAGLLEAATARPAATNGAADGSAASGTAEFSRAKREARAGPGIERWTQAVGPERGSDALYGAAGRLQDPAAPLHATGRPDRQLADRGSGTGGNRTPDRLFRQHVAAADGP